MSQITVFNPYKNPSGFVGFDSRVRQSGSGFDRVYDEKSGSGSGFRKSGPGRVFVGFLETRSITNGVELKTNVLIQIENI